MAAAPGGTAPGTRPTGSIPMAAAAAAAASSPQANFDPAVEFGPLELIGEGTYGCVYKAKKKSPSDTRTYALKRTKNNNASQLDGLSVSVTREIALLTELNHENIITVKDIAFSAQAGGQPDVWLTFEYAEFDIWGILSHHRANKYPAGMPPEPMQKSMTRQVLCGIDYLHNNWVLHRDLKPANILVMGPGPECGRVKIADLGMARLFHSPIKPLTEVDGIVVTYWYRAPELLLGAKHYTKAIDMWAVGCIMAEMMLPRPLFWIRNDDTKEVYNKDQLQQIFNICGRPSPRPSSGLGSSAIPPQLDWPSMDQLPCYQRMITDLGELDPRMCEDKLKSNLPRVSEPKLQLLKGLLRFDADQRLTAAAALRTPYLRDPDYNPDNVFFPNSSAAYPARQIIDKKTKEPPKSESQGRGSAAKRSRSEK
eukprot:m.88171 g.88171  ORF g.88171 m.88171 type:complete len:424 (-) comp13612_c1_seq3:36-1307(-)